MDTILEATEWVVPWAMWGWATLFIVLLIFELYTLWWNNEKGDGKQRANLTAYVSAFFRVGNRRLKYSASAAILIAVFIYFLGHFLEWWK